MEIGMILNLQGKRGIRKEEEEKKRKNFKHM
jgi:hypothetical protein